MSWKQWKKGMVMIVVGMMMLSLIGCGTDTSQEEVETVGSNNETEANKEKEDVVLKLGGGDWGYPSPYLHYSRGPGIYKMQLIFDSLLEYGEEGLIPWLAKEWEVSEDGLNYIFTLQEGVKWHDGQVLTAEDVKFSFEFSEKHPPVQNYIMVGDQSIIKEIEILEDGRVKFTFAEKNATILEKIGTVRIIPEHIWSEVEDPESFQDERAVIGCGPYTLTNYSKEHSTYEFTAFKDYWGPKQKVEKIQFVPVSDEIMAFENEEIDQIGVGADLLDRYMGDPTFTVLENPAFWGYRLTLNMEKNPIFKEKEIRQAIAYGIDQQEMVDKVERGAAVVASAGYLPEDHVWYNPAVKKYPFDEDKAKTLLGDEKVSFQLLTGNSNAEVRIAELMKISLDKVGIEVNVQSADTKTRDNAIVTGNYEVALTGHGGWGNDADILRTRYSDILGYDNEEINKLALEQLQELDTEKRKEMIFSLQELISEEMPMIPIYNTTGYTVYRPSTYDGWMYMFDHHNVSHGKLSYLERK
ncbi:extracellular solute-binding protein, family 5 [Alkaliphilus metalliredigens QYMF]|uniref:Extracellular solute-binding protein, family 5 n=1 Tax=Alkaliphilus metalliredigens (strain QYMF) TaxID=293826 RepID=A6TND8_ALKMQ|nr:ABC transporter substrate-binding protein [Alkaliphilus metalliredigens]ABR47706.1 extracellular solute-binding protein, family 5 [Alkaliphilus metalliredigens QYMF]